ALATAPDCRERFMREARSAALVASDYIVPIYQVGEDEGVPYLAMQFLKGESLDLRLKRDRMLPVPELLHIGRQIALGLAAAHEHGLIHRDIKPANVFLEDRPAADRGDGRGRTAPDGIPVTPTFARVKILDFGLARAVDGDSRVTRSGAVLGTPSYMAPEQAD